jgi:hypothetical protein
MWIERGRQVERGQSAVEFALLVSVLLIFIMAILDLGRGLYAYTAITAAAQEGVRYALIHPGDGVGVGAVVRNPTALQNRCIPLSLNMSLNILKLGDLLIRRPLPEGSRLPGRGAPHRKLDSPQQTPKFSLLLWRDVSYKHLNSNRSLTDRQIRNGRALSES